MQGFEVPPADNIKSSLPNFKRQTKPFAEWAAEYLRSWNEMKHTWYSKRHNHLIYLIPVCEIYGAPQWISFESKATVSTQRTLSNVPSSLPIRACISKEKTRSRHQSHRWLTCTRNLYTTWSLMLHWNLLGSSATRTSEAQYSTRQVYQQDMRDEAVVLLRTRMCPKENAICNYFTTAEKSSTANSYAVRWWIWFILMVYRWTLLRSIHPNSLQVPWFVWV